MNNAFAKDVNYLKELYQKQKRVEELKELEKNAKAEEKRLKKSLAHEVKSCNEEKNTTIKKRKNEIAATYEEEISNLQSKVKRIENERESHKSKQQNKRYWKETKGMRQELDTLESELRTLIKKNRIPRICRSNLYYSLFLPHGIKDHMIRFLWCIIMVLGLPAVVCWAGSMSFLQQMQERTIFYVLIFMVFLCFTVTLYLFISNRTKMRFQQSLDECRGKIDQIRAMRKQMKAVHKGIHRDKDESEYGLESYDEKLKDYNEQIDTITANKNAALKDFEENKQPVIEKELAEPHETTIADISQKLSELEGNLNAIASELKDLKLDLSNQYEAYLGKENVSLSRVETLIAIMEEESIATVGEAIAIYEKRK